MATKSIVRVSDLPLLTNITGAEEVTVSYLTPHKVVTSTEVTYIGSYQYIYNSDTKKYEYSYVVTDKVETPKTWRIDTSIYESYKFPLNMINGGNISNVIYNYSKDDFDYVSNSEGTHVKIGEDYYKYEEAYNSAVSSYITKAQTFTYEVILPSEENGLQGYIKYIPYDSKYNHIGNIVEYNSSYITKSEMLSTIKNVMLNDRYNITGVNTMTIRFDNNTDFSIQATNGSKGPQGERGWKGDDGEKGISAFDFYENADLSNAYSLVTDPANEKYDSKSGVVSAQFGYNVAQEISQYKEIFTTDENYATISEKEKDTNYFTFEEDGNKKYNKIYNIGNFLSYTDEIIVPPVEEPEDSSDEFITNDSSDELTIDTSVNID